MMVYSAPQQGEAPEAPYETMLRVEGMSCGHCTGSVDRALRAVAGVVSCSVDLDTKLARVGGNVAANILVDAVEATGKKTELVPRTELLVEGMMCGHCTGSVERAMRAVADVVDVRVDLESKICTVYGTAPVAQLLEACAATGKTAQLVATQLPEPPPAAPSTVMLRVEGMMCGHWCVPPAAVRCIRRACREHRPRNFFSRR